MLISVWLEIGQQRGNPMLDMIRFVPWEFGNINADYQLAPTTGMLFLRHVASDYTRRRSTQTPYFVYSLLSFTNDD